MAHGRSAWVSAASFLATTALIALAVGAPAAYAVSGEDVPVVVTVDPMATTAPLATPDPVPPVSPDPTASGSGTPTVPTAAITPAHQAVDAVVDAPINPTTAFTADGLSGSITYTIEPALPSGLDLDPASGVISGTARSAQKATGYIVTASDGTASATATIAITVAAAPVSGPSLTPAIQVVKAVSGEPITATEPLTASGFDADVVFSVAPDLPHNLTLNPNTGVVSGIVLQAQKATDYVITASDGSSGAEASVTISAAPVITPTEQLVEGVITEPLIPTARFDTAGFAGLVTYSILPELPGDLVLEPATGIITGTPTTIETATPFVIVGTDGTFEATSLLTLTTTCPKVYVAEPLPAQCPVFEAPPLVPGGSNPKPMGLLVGAAAVDPIHGPYANATTVDTCARCHSTHNADDNKFLSNGSSTQQALCFTCHDGTGAPAPSISAQYSGAGTTAGFSHNIANPTKPHVDAIVDEDGVATPVEEFKATLNRHAECTDCHNPHSSFISTGKPLSTMTATGWTASGRIQRVSGVAVTNGAAGQAPTSYTFLNGVTDPLSAEYQLCFKCHSSYTTLPAGAADIALEFNPAVKSYHPVEAPGKNTSTAMANSLAGTSSYKIWSFKVGDTVRCLHCHASGTKTEVTTSGSTIVPQDPHAVPNTSPNRDGILLLNYNRSDTPITYNQANFALCFACHAADPMTNSGSAATNFSLHQKHVGKGYTCQECHYRLHSTARPVTPTGGGTVTIDGGGLVTFPPSVTASSGTLRFTRASPGNGTCTLICHGKDHQNWSY